MPVSFTDLIRGCAVTTCDNQGRVTDQAVFNRVGVAKAYAKTRIEALGGRSVDDQRRSARAISDLFIGFDADGSSGVEVAASRVLLNQTSIASDFEVV